jgi:hypothetical protein
MAAYCWRQTAGSGLLAAYLKGMQTTATLVLALAQAGLQGS